MKKLLSLFFLITASIAVHAQAGTSATPTIDSSKYGTVVVNKDKRIDVLGEKMYAYNVALAKNIRSGRGFRLMLLSTNDRNVAMTLRSRLLQLYPEHKVYMAYQNPFIKLKLGNFVEKADAEKFKKLLMAQKLVTGNIYVLPETIEIKPSETDDEQL
ncbi:MAG: SPOR domain-containing protein [Pedobacter sp.]|nr:MAG: SPOR domain-containing protein [Pedobacter sp.]